MEEGTQGSACEKVDLGASRVLKKEHVMRHNMRTSLQWITVSGANGAIRTWIAMGAATCAVHQSSIPAGDLDISLEVSCHK